MSFSLKPLTHIAWAVLLIASCLFTRIHCCPECQEVRTDTIWVQSAAISVTDTNPKPVSVRPNKAIKPRLITVSGQDRVDTVFVSQISPCDSIRDYLHTAGDSSVAITVESTVEGKELFNRITYRLNTPVIYKTQTLVLPRKFTVYGMAGGVIGGHSDAVIGGGVMFRRYGVNYLYMPLNRSHIASVGIRIY